MSAQTKVEVTRGVFDPRTYKQVKVMRSSDYNFSGQDGINLFLMGNHVKSLSSCGQWMWWWKSGTIQEFALTNHPKWAMSEILIWNLKHSKHHIVNQKMTTFEMFMKNEATYDILVRFCISRGSWPKHWWKISSTLVVKLYDSFWNNRNAFWIFVAHIAGSLCSRDWKYSQY